MSIIAYGDRATLETLCPTCAATRYPNAFPVEFATDVELERLGEIHAHDLDDDSCPCDVCGDELAPAWGTDCPECNDTERCEDCERSYGPRR